MIKTLHYISVTASLLLMAGCATGAPVPGRSSVPPIPSEATKLPSPVAVPAQTGSTLDLSRRGLTNVSQDVFWMTGLEVLDVSGNALTGSLPAEIRQLRNLRELRAGDNAMTGVPAEIGQLSNLRVLDLSDNQLTGLPNELGNLLELETLDLRGNAVSQQDLEGIRSKLVRTNILTS